LICSACIFWLKDDDQDDEDQAAGGCGWCRRFPPIVTGVRVKTTTADWCGEFSARARVDPE
jgi:hypothetical protein